MRLKRAPVEIFLNRRVSSAGWWREMMPRSSTFTRHFRSGLFLSAPDTCPAFDCRSRSLPYESMWTGNISLSNVSIDYPLELESTPSPVSGWQNRVSISPQAERRSRHA